MYSNTNNIIIILILVCINILCILNIITCISVRVFKKLQFQEYNQYMWFCFH